MTNSYLLCVFMMLGAIQLRPAEFNRFDKSRREEPLYRIFSGGKYGFINARGEVVVAPRFRRADRCSEGLCFVSDGKLGGYIGES
jgi:WG containing repeat